MMIEKITGRVINADDAFMVNKINELVDAVNEIKGIEALIDTLTIEEWTETVKAGQKHIVKLRILLKRCLTVMSEANGYCADKLPDEWDQLKRDIREFMDEE